MSSMKILSAVEQVSAHLQEGMLEGQWIDSLPGVDALAIELGVSRKTVDAALRKLERDGWLVSQGPRRRRRIELKADINPPALRVAILADETATRRPRYIVEAMHQLIEAGHIASFAPGNMSELGKDTNRIEKMVKRTAADAWVVMSGPQNVLKWFCDYGKPTIAVFGRWQGLPMAGVGPNKVATYTEAVRTLVGLGHRRIVLLARKMGRVPGPGEAEQAFLDELDANGIPAGPYNLPDWSETVDGLNDRLESLFRTTPPTSLILDEAPLFAATQQFLAKRKILVPEDISLICTDFDATFAWCKPSIAHIKWESQPLVSKITRWAARVSRGKNDIKQTLVPSKFVTGGTVGPAKK